MSKMDGVSFQWLYDDTTGRLIGFRTSDGIERFFARTEAEQVDSDLVASTPSQMSYLNVTPPAAGAGITGGTGTVYASSVERIGTLIKTSFILDVTGLASSTTDLDIIGQGTDPAYLMQITAAGNGTIFAGKVTCLETPAGGVDDIDVYAATEGTGVFDGGVASLTETALLTRGASWAVEDTKVLTALPTDGDYLYITGGAAGTAATYTAGKFLVELLGV